MNANNIQDGDIPPGLENSAATHFSFYKVQNPLENQEHSRKIVKCVVLLTKSSDFIEIEDGVVRRIERVRIETPIKVLVHHEFSPFRRFIIILTVKNSAHLLDFQNLKSLNMWVNIKDADSNDSTNCGRPNLILTKTSGESFTVSQENFLIERSAPAEQNCKSEAATALSNKVMAIMGLAEALETERIRKEKFVCQKISSLANQLQRIRSQVNESLHLEDNQLNFASASNNTSDPLFTNNGLRDEQPPLEVLFTKQRIIRNKWAIFIYVVNHSERYKIQNINLILHSEEPSKSFRFESRLCTISQKTSKIKQLTSSEIAEVDVVNINPPVLAPKQKAFLLAHCDFPDFYMSEKISCNGVITFEIQTSNDISNNRMTLQVAFPSVYLSATRLKSVSANNIREQGIGGIKGFTMDFVTLMATSVIHTMYIKSRATPLGQVIETINKDPRIIKLPQVRDFYCFNAEECHPLHLAAFICKPITATKLLLTTYTKNDNQGIILVHNLKAMLPCDAFISCQKDSMAKDSASVAQNLLTKMHLTISKIQDAFSTYKESTTITKKRRKDEPESTTDSTNQLDNRWRETEYLPWRHEVNSLWLEMEFLLRIS